MTNNKLRRLADCGMTSIRPIFTTEILTYQSKARGGGVLMYLYVRGRAAEQGIIFRIPTPGQGTIFVKIGSLTGSIFAIFDPERSS